MPLRTLTNNRLRTRPYLEGDQYENPTTVFMFWSTAVVCPQLRAHEHICQGIRRLIFRQFPVVFVLPDTCKNILGNAQILGNDVKMKVRSRPDGLFGVAQIMLCVIENSIAKVPATVAQCPFFFHRQAPLSQEKARPIMTIFGASKTFEREKCDGYKKDSSAASPCHKRDSFSLCPRS